MGDYLRLLTVSDRGIPLASLQRAATIGAVWSVDHPGMLGNYLALGPDPQNLQSVWATVERNPVGPNTLGAEEVAEFIDGLEAGGPPAAVRWLTDFLEAVRAIYAIRVYPEAIRNAPDAIEAIAAVLAALRQTVGGVGQWDDHGFTNEDDRLIWCTPASKLTGPVHVALLDESTGAWLPYELNFARPQQRAAFLHGALHRELRHPGV